MKKTPIKKIMFYDNIYDIDAETQKENGTLLFKASTWYNVKFVADDEDQIQVIAETGEKIGFSMNDNPSIFCVRR